MATVENVDADGSDESARTRATKVLSGTSTRPPDSPGKVVVGVVAGGVVTALGANVSSGVAVLDAGCAAAFKAGAGLPATDGVLGTSGVANTTSAALGVEAGSRSSVATDGVILGDHLDAADRAFGAEFVDGAEGAVRARLPADSSAG